MFKNNKGYVLNPRGQALYNDESRFGTKLLKKMGWTPGKGLGANENGNTEFIRPVHKPDNAGVGCVERSDQWTQHDANFNELLKTLGNNNSEENNTSNNSQSTKITSGESLEQKSSQSRARVHYQKFTRGKDLSQYSEKDLANIFGQRSINETNAVKEKYTPEEVAPEEDTPEEQSDIDTNSKIIYSKISVNDYFKNIWKKKNSKKSVETGNDEEGHSNLNNEEQTNNCYDIKTEDDEPPKKKKKKKQHDLISENNDDDVIIHNNHIEEKQKSQNFETNEIPNDFQSDKNENSINLNIAEKLSKKKKKKIKNKLINESYLEDSNDALTKEVKDELIDIEILEKPLKKKNKHKIFSNGNHEENGKELEASFEFENKKEQKKMKNYKPKNVEIQNELDSNITIDSTSFDKNLKSKEKKKKNQKKQNESIQSNDDISIINSKTKVNNNFVSISSLKEHFKLFDKFGITEVVQFKSHQVENFSNLKVNGFKNSNFDDIIGYGLTEDPLMEIIKTKNFKVEESTYKDLVIHRQYKKSALQNISIKHSCTNRNILF